MRNLPLKQVPTMRVTKWSWRKPLRPEKGAVICTRLILSAVLTAVKKYAIQRGSVRTICPCKCPNRTVKGGARPTLLPVPIHAPPGQADDSWLLTKINDGCCSDTRPGSHKNQTYNSSKKRMLPRKAASSNIYFTLTVLSLVHCFQHLSRCCFLPGRKGCPTIKHFLQIRSQFHHFSLSKELG